MIYLNEKHIRDIGINWSQLGDAITNCIHAMSDGDFAQPVKPYLRYRDKVNRIIAMPAFVGSDIKMSGIKWIASFPGNLKRGIPRAHSVTILNESNTGVPVCTINTALISGLRTAAVSRAVLQRLLSLRKLTGKVKVGVCGLGPIGLLHLDMLINLLGENIRSVDLFDLNETRLKYVTGRYASFPVNPATRWEDCFTNADIFITCTVSSERYINIKPKPGSIHFNISLRDYEPGFCKYVNHFIVDDWEEVCRENTDIENMHLKFGLSKQDSNSIIDLFSASPLEKLDDSDVIMFNPMGMAVFDIAIASHYYTKGRQLGVGVNLED